MHVELTEECVRQSRSVAKSSGIGFDAYLATNGQMSRETARRVAGLFTRVGLSCDGPPEIQNHQRPLANGGNSSEAIVRTARILAQFDIPVEVRATIMPENVKYLTDVVAYACHALHARCVRVEPRFGESGWRPDDARHFADQFQLAAVEAQSCEAELLYAGLRPTEIHGSYCDTSRDVLRLLPNGNVSACFLGETSDGASTQIGRFESETGRLVFDEEQIRRFQKCHATIADTCRRCPAVFHCSRGCPTHCSAREALSDGHEFRCLLHRELLARWLSDAVEKQKGPMRVQSRWLSTRIEEEFNAIEDPWLRERVSSQWERCQGYYPLGRPDMPRPAWMHKGLALPEADTWAALEDEAKASKASAISIYVHVPFCASRCGFCDCPLFGCHGR